MGPQSGNGSKENVAYVPACVSVAFVKQEQMISQITLPLQADFSQRLLVSECALRGWTFGILRCSESLPPRSELRGARSATTQQPLRDVSFELGGEGLACLKQMQGFTDFDARSEVLHCLKPGTGCRDAPRCFSLKLRQVTEAYGLQPSSIDSQLELLFEAGVLIMMILKHVDDLKMAGKRKVIEDFVRHVSQTFGKMDVEWQDFTFCGVHHQQHADGSISLDQIKFLSACKPIAQQAAFAGGTHSYTSRGRQKAFPVIANDDRLCFADAARCGSFRLGLAARVSQSTGYPCSSSEPTA